MKNNTAESNKEHAFHVLVVDDEYLIRHVTAKVLKNQGISVDLAANGLEAQGKILAGHHYDLVITDINMPEMDGLELLLWLKKHRPLIDGIVMTGYDVSDLQSNKQLEWVRDYLIKPFSMDKLQEAVKRSMIRMQCHEKRKIEKSE